MAISIVQSSRNSALPGTPVSFTVTATGAGNLLVALFITSAANTTITAMDDGLGHNFIHAANCNVSQVASGATDIWYLPNSTAGATTMSYSCTNNLGIQCEFVEYSGAATISPLVDSQGVSNTTQPSKGPVLTTTDVGDVAVTTFNAASTAPTSASAPWVEIPGSANFWFTEARPAGVSGTIQAVFNPGNQSSATAGAVFAIAPSGPSAKQKSSSILVF